MRQGQVHMLAPLGPRKTGEEQGQLHVFKSGKHRDKVVKLENETHVRSPPLGEPGFAETGNIHAADGDTARIHVVYARDKVEKGRFARA